MSVGPRGAARLARRQQPGQQTVKGRIMAEPRSAEPAQLRLIVAQQLGDDEQQHPGLRLLVWVVAGGIAVAVGTRLAAAIRYASASLAFRIRERTGNFAGFRSIANI